MSGIEYKGESNAYLDINKEKINEHYQCIQEFLDQGTRHTNS